MATKKKKKRAARETPTALAGADAVDAFVKAKQAAPTRGSWLKGLAGEIRNKTTAAALSKALSIAGTEELGVEGLEKAIEERLIGDRVVQRLAPNLGAKPEEVRITILEVQRLFGLPERVVRRALNDGLMGGINFAGRTGWLTTVPEVRTYLKGVENPGVITKLENRIAELEAETKRLKKAA